MSGIDSGLGLLKGDELPSVLDAAIPLGGSGITAPAPVR